MFWYMYNHSFHEVSNVTHGPLDNKTRSYSFNIRQVGSAFTSHAGEKSLSPNLSRPNNMQVIKIPVGTESSPANGQLIGPLDETIKLEVLPQWA